jgi:hypothetical protein
MQPVYLRAGAYRLGLDKPHVVVLRIHEGVLIESRMLRRSPHHPDGPLALRKNSATSKNASLSLSLVFGVVVSYPRP